MSIFAVAWALDGADVDDIKSKLVLISLAENADNETRQCWPSIPYIAKRCKLSRSSIYRAIISLKKQGFITIEHRRWPSGVRRSPLYTVLFPMEKPSLTQTQPSLTQTQPSVTAETRRTVTEPSQRKNGVYVLKKEERKDEIREGFKAVPQSREFLAWKQYAFEKKVALWRELQKREIEGRPFDFETQWPPN